MIWNSGIALIGLFALAIPLWIHLLSRRNARVQEFPSLRFLDVAPLVQARRSRLNDLLLLFIRLGITALAVCALAQPVFLSAARKRAAGEVLARAIVIDTSASMQRLTSSGTTALVQARASAERFAREANATLVLESANPAEALYGATTWLRPRAGKRELVIVSDFQLGSIDPTDIAAVPSEIGLLLTRIDSVQSPAALESRTRRAGHDIVANTTLKDGQSDVTWRVRAETPDSSTRGPSIFAGPLGRSRAAAALEAALRVGTPITIAGAHPVAVIFPDYEGFTEMVRSAGPLNAPWMGDIVARIRRDAALAAAATSMLPQHSIDTSRSSPLTPVIRNADGRALVLAAQSTVAGAKQLVLVPLVDPGSMTSATLIAALYNAMSSAPPTSELDPAQMGNADLRALERDASVVAPRTADEIGGESDARLFWIGALLLLGIESVLRRRSRPAKQPQEIPA